MSGELRDFFLSEFRKKEGDILKFVRTGKSLVGRIDVPYSDVSGIIKTATYNADLDRIESIRVPISRTNPQTAEWLHPSAVYCDECSIETIDIPQ